MAYKTAYVASISLGADMNQAIKAFKEAEAYNGVSIIIAYAPCINHGLDMSNSNGEMKKAVACGYWNLYRFNPTVHFVNLNEMKTLWEKFISEETAEDRIFYVWGHSYEIDAGHLSWEEFDDFCKMVSGRKDVFYGTNSEVLLNQKLYK